MTDRTQGPLLGDMLASALRTYADSPVLELDEVALTGAEMEVEISRFVRALAGFGVVRGSAVGLLALNRPEVLLVIGAGQTQGYRRTALHPLGSAEDHAYVLADAGVETLVIDPVFADRAQELLGLVPGLRQVLTLGPSEVGEDLVAVASGLEAGPLQVEPLSADQEVAVTYTGGTTGRPKGVVGTAGSLAAMTRIQLDEWEWPDRPRFLICTPLSHAGAAFFTPVVGLGGSMVVLPRFDAGQVLEAIERERITATMLVPSMLYALLDHPDAATRDLSSLQTVYYGASAMNPVRLAEAIERFGPIFAQYYGQSEAPMVISYFAKGDHVDADGRPLMARLSSCGRPSRSLRTALLDDDSRPVAPGEPGEICVAGAIVSQGYRGLPEETAATFRDGWLRTGDVAREDADGFWYIVDRTKDMIVTGGFNVFPREVEDVLATHPAVAQVAVIGTPDEKWGECVTAVVVLRDPEGRPDARAGEGLDAELEAELVALVKERKGSVQAPKRIHSVAEIPVTALGKPDKKALRARYWEGRTRSVG